MGINTDNLKAVQCCLELAKNQFKSSLAYNLTISRCLFRFKIPGMVSPSLSSGKNPRIQIGVDYALQYQTSEAQVNMASSVGLLSCS